MFFLNLIVFTSLFYTRERFCCKCEKAEYVCREENCLIMQFMKYLLFFCSSHETHESSGARSPSSKLQQMLRNFWKPPFTATTRNFTSSGSEPSSKIFFHSILQMNDDNIDNLFDERLKLTRTFSHCGHIAFCLVLAQAPYWLH